MPCSCLQRRTPVFTPNRMPPAFQAGTGGGKVSLEGADFWKRILNRVYDEISCMLTYK